MLNRCNDELVIKAGLILKMQWWFSA